MGFGGLPHSYFPRVKSVGNFTEYKFFHKNMYGMIAEPPIQIIFGLYDYQ